MSLYFAYGSNMCSGRFRAYGVAPEGVGQAALLAGYQLRFNKRSTDDDSGKANVEAEPASEVWGVLYTVPPSALSVLDKGEGGYRRIQLVVRTPDNKNINAWVYVAKRPDNSPTLRPYAWYKRFLVEGAREHSLPAGYVDRLEQVEAIDDADTQRDAAKRRLVCRHGDQATTT